MNRYVMRMLRIYNNMQLILQLLTMNDCNTYLGFTSCCGAASASAALHSVAIININSAVLSSTGLANCQVIKPIFINKNCLKCQ